MKETLDTAEVRSLTILNFLYEEDRWFTVQEISEKIYFSPDTTYKALHHIKKTLEQNNASFKLSIQPNKGVYLSSSNKYSLSTLECTFLKETMSYKLIDLIFQRNNLTIEQLAEELYASKSTVYRKLKKIALFFKHNNLTLNLTTFEISGPEYLIREFYFIFYWSFLKSGEWPFTSVPLKLIKYRIDQTSTKSTSLLLSIEKIKLAYKLAINFIRHQKQAFITELPLADKISPCSYQELNVLAEFVDETTPRSAHKLETAYLLLGFLPSMYIHSEVKNSTQILAWHEEHQTLLLTFAKEIEDLVQQHFFVATDNLATKKRLVQLIGVSQYLHVFKALSIEDASIDNKLIPVKDEEVSHFNTLLEILLSLKSSPVLDGNEAGISYLLYYCLTIYRDVFLLNMVEVPVKIKIICASKPSAEPFLKNILQKKLDLPLEISLSGDVKQKDDVYDLLLSDLFLTELDLPKAHHTYIWNSFPSARDWNKIDAIITKIKENQQNTRKH